MCVVLGDHGMSDSGSHGGSSVPEVTTPIVALFPGKEEEERRKRKRLSQVVLQPDLVRIVILFAQQSTHLHTYWPFTVLIYC